MDLTANLVFGFRQIKRISNQFRQIGIYGGEFLNNKGIGAIFCLISAVLMSARYIAAAIFMSNVVSWDSSLFQAGLSYVGSPLKVAAIIALIAGICFLVYGVVRDFKKQDK